MSPSPRTESSSVDTGAAFHQKSVGREYLESLVVCVLFLLGVRHFVFLQSKVPTGSMLETLLIGDYIGIDRMIYGAPGDPPRAWLGQREIRRGDVIVFRLPEDPDVDLVKRVIALPGETWEMKDGLVYINGELLKEPYVLPENIEAGRNEGAQVIPPGHYFCMGDNRDESRDSRYWGPVARELVKGRAFLIWYSYDEIRNDHLNTGIKRIGSIFRKLLRPDKIRFSRLFHLIR